MVARRLQGQVPGASVGMLVLHSPQRRFAARVRRVLHGKAIVSRRDCEDKSKCAARRRSKPGALDGGRATGLRVWAGGCGGGRRRGGARVEGWRVFGGPEWRGRFSLKCFDDYHVYYKSPSHGHMVYLLSVHKSNHFPRLNLTFTYAGSQSRRRERTNSG